VKESVTGQIKRLIEEGETPDRVTETVMADLPRRWKDFARPFVLRFVRGVEGQVVNRRMRRVFTGTRGTHNREQAVERLHSTVYRLPSGQRVLWDDMTVEYLELKIAQLRKHVGALVGHLRILEAARKLCADRGVERLGDIPGWVDLVQEEIHDDTEGEDTSGEVQAA
jgi:hypothetical protein